MSAACPTSEGQTEVLQESKLKFRVQILLRVNNIRLFYFQPASLKIDFDLNAKNRDPYIFTNLTNHPRIASRNSQTMLHMSKNRLFDKNHMCGPHLVQVITFQLGSGKMFQEASFTVSCCHFQHSLSTRKDCHCMRHANPCIRPATFTNAMQLHACDIQLHAFAMHPLHAPCNSMHVPCTLCKCHATPCICSATPLKLNRLQTTQSV